MQTPRPAPRPTDADILAAARAIVARSSATMLYARRRDDPPAAAHWVAPAPPRADAGALSRRGD